MSLFTFAKVQLESLFDTNRTYNVSNAFFKRVDKSLRAAYWRENPYKISKEFLKLRGEENVYQYGETFLLTFREIAKACNLNYLDHFVDLGAGRGRVAFYAACVYGCKVTALEQVPKFIHIGQKIAKEYEVDIRFIEGDFTDFNLAGATKLYFNGVTLPEKQVKKLAEKIPKGAETISVSEPLSQVSDRFSIEKKIICQYPWGKTEVYIERCQKK